MTKHYNTLKDSASLSAFFSSMVITIISLLIIVLLRLPCPPLAKRGSLTHSQALALSKRARDVTALRCSEPLRSKVGGPSKVFAILCGMGPPYFSLLIGGAWGQHADWDRLANVRVST